MKVDFLPEITPKGEPMQNWVEMISEEIYDCGRYEVNGKYCYNAKIAMYLLFDANKCKHSSLSLLEEYIRGYERGISYYRENMKPPVGISPDSTYFNDLRNMCYNEPKAYLRKAVRGCPMPYGRGVLSKFEEYGFYAGITTEVIEYAICNPSNMVGFFSKDGEKAFGINTPKITQSKKEKTFADLLIYEGSKGALIEELRDLFNGGKPKKIATIIMALNELGYLDTQKGERSTIYRAYIAEFGYSRGRGALERGVNMHMGKKNKDTEPYVQRLKCIAKEGVGD